MKLMANVAGLTAENDALKMQLGKLHNARAAVLVKENSNKYPRTFNHANQGQG